MAVLMCRGADEDIALGNHFEGSDMRALLVSDLGTPPSNFRPKQYVSEVLTGGVIEVSSTGYSRQVLGTKTSTWDAGNNRMEYGHAAINFGSISNASNEGAAAVVFYRHVTTDANSPVWMIDDTATGLGNKFANGPVTYTPTADGLFQTRIPS